MGSHQRWQPVFVSDFVSGTGGAGLSSLVAAATGSSACFSPGAAAPWAKTTANTAAKAPNVRGQLLMSISTHRPTQKKSASAVLRGPAGGFRAPALSY